MYPAEHTATTDNACGIGDTVAQTDLYMQVTFQDCFTAAGAGEYWYQVCRNKTAPNAIIAVYCATDNEPAHVSGIICNDYYECSGDFEYVTGGLVNAGWACPFTVDKTLAPTSTKPPTSAPPTTGTPSFAPTFVPSNDPVGSKTKKTTRLSKGAVAGIAVACVVVVVIGAIIVRTASHRKGYEKVPSTSGKVPM